MHRLNCLTLPKLDLATKKLRCDLNSTEYIGYGTIVITIRQAIDDFAKIYISVRLIWFEIYFDYKFSRSNGLFPCYSEFYNNEMMYMAKNTSSAHIQPENNSIDAGIEDHFGPGRDMLSNDSRQLSCRYNLKSDENKILVFTVNIGSIRNISSKNLDMFDEGE